LARPGLQPELSTPERVEQVERAAPMVRRQLEVLAMRGSAAWERQAAVAPGPFGRREQARPERVERLVGQQERRSPEVWAKSNSAAWALLALAVALSARPQLARSPQPLLPPAA